MRVCPKCFSLFADQERCPQDEVPTVHYTEVLVGLNLGPYIVRSMVSEGGMGVVYVGEHPTLGRRVAMKVLRPELSLRDDIVERFVQEARAVNTIGHANIVNIYDFGRTPFGTFYIVMEFLEGRTLRALLDSAGPQPLERVRFVVEGIGAALDAAHNKGFLHRDVKPENVMVGHRGGTEYVKLLDFGIAKLLTSGNTTATSSTLGTPQYMSPEQLDDAKLDRRSDIFSFGCVIYELLTGQVPFPGGSQAGVRQAQLTRQPPPPSICRRDVYISPRVDEAVLRAIALGPEERQQTMGELLEAFREGFDATIREQNTAPRSAPQRRPASSWKIFAISGAFAVLLGTIAALVILLVAKDDKPATTRGDAGTQVAPKKPRPAKKLTPRQLAEKRIETKLSSQTIKAIAEVRPPALERTLRAVLAGKADEISKRYAIYTLEALGVKPTKLLEPIALGQGATATYAAIRAASILASAGNQRAKTRLQLMERKLRTNGNNGKSIVALCELARLDPKLRERALASYRKANRWEQAVSLRCLDLPGGLALAEAKAFVKDKRARFKTRIQVAELLEKVPDGWLRRALKLVKRPSDPSKRRAWARKRIRLDGLLARRGDQDSRKNLVRCLDDSRSLARAQCAVELGRLQTVAGLGEDAARVRAKLIEVMKGGGDDRLKTNAAIALMAFFEQQKKK